MNNLGLKALSVLIASLLCIYVNSDNNISSARLFVPIEVRDLPQDKVIIGQLKKQVEVEVRGPSFLVSRLVTSPPTLRIRLPQEVGARYTAQINRSDLDIQSPLQVLSIEPSSISFTVESKISRDLPVKVPQIGIINENIRIDDIKVTPEKVTVIGPESELRELQNITTAPIDLREVTKSFNEDLVLRVPGKQSELSQNSVKVQVSANPINVKRTFETLPVEVRTASGEAVRVEPASVLVTVMGTKDRIDKVDPSSVIPFVRAPGNAVTNDIVSVQVELPDGISLSAVSPHDVKIIRARIGMKEKQIKK